MVQEHSQFFDGLSRTAAFAEYVLLKYGGSVLFGGPFVIPEFDEECNIITSENVPNPRIHILMTAANRLDPTSDREQHIKVLCYICAGSSGYDNVIELAPDLIKNSDFSWECYPETARWNLKHFLVKTYERRKMWWEAVELYDELHRDYPWESHYVEGLVRCFNALGLYDVAMTVIEDVKASVYYNMSGFDYHMAYWNGEYDKWVKRHSDMGFPIESRERYLSRIVLPDPPINLLKHYTDIAELSIGRSIVRRRNRDDYDWISANLPSMCPKSYGGYKRMKSQKTKNFLKLATACLELGRDIQIEDEYTLQAKQLAEIRAKEEAAYWERRKIQEKSI